MVIERLWLLFSYCNLPLRPNRLPGNGYGNGCSTGLELTSYCLYTTWRVTHVGCPHLDELALHDGESLCVECVQKLIGRRSLPDATIVWCVPLSGLDHHDLYADITVTFVELQHPFNCNAPE